MQRTSWEILGWMSYKLGSRLLGEISTTSDTQMIPSSVVQSCPTLCNPMNCSTPASLSITNSRSSLRLTSTESVMPSSHLVLCRPLFLLPPIPPSIRVFSNESTLRMMWPKYWSFRFSIIPSKVIVTLRKQTEKCYPGKGIDRPLLKLSSLFYLRE